MLETPFFLEAIARYVLGALFFAFVGHALGPAVLGLFVLLLAPLMIAAASLLAVAWTILVFAGVGLLLLVVLVWSRRRMQLMQAAPAADSARAPHDFDP